MFFYRYGSITNPISGAALAEDGSRTVVYTALDKEGKPANPVAVTIGLSDGITAEILERGIKSMDDDATVVVIRLTAGTLPPS